MSKKEEVSKPSAGPVRVHGDKGNASVPSSGVVEHPEKSDGKNRQEALSQPAAGGTARPEKQDGKNRREAIATPEGGDAAIPTERLHLDKVRAHENRTHEPKPAGKADSSGHPFKTTKRD